jgi:hypothetical protein
VRLRAAGQRRTDLDGLGTKPGIDCKRQGTGDQKNLGGLGISGR